MNEQDFFIRLKRSAELLKKLCYLQLPFVIPVLFYDLLGILPVICFAALAYYARNLKASLSEFSVEVVRDRTWLAEAAMDDAVRCHGIVYALNIIAIPLLVLFLVFAFRGVTWLFILLIPFITNFINAAICYNIMTELRVLRMIVSHYNMSVK